MPSAHSDVCDGKSLIAQLRGNLVRPSERVNEIAVGLHSRPLSFVAIESNMFCSALTATSCSVRDDQPDITSPSGRLKWARIRAGFESAAAFAERCRMKAGTYRKYEDGDLAYAKHAPEFARKLGITTDWLLRGGPIPAPGNATEPYVPPPELLARIMVSALHAERASPAKQAEIRVAARGVGRALRMLAKNPAKANDPDFVDSVAEIAAEEAFHHAQQSSSL